MRILTSFVLATALAVCGACSSSPPTALRMPGADAVPPVIVGGADAMLVAGADLALTKVADRKNVKIGETITFTITVTNLGSDAATDVVFGDPLPDPLNLVSFSSAQGLVSCAF